MPDKKLTDSEIVKALECLEKDTNCRDCAVLKQCKGDCVFTKTLDLINRLQAENERLTQDKKTMSADMISLHNDLKSEKEVVCDKHFKIARLTKEIKTAKAEAYKELAEKIKEKTLAMVYSETLLSAKDYIECIDNVVKEMEVKTCCTCECYHTENVEGYGTCQAKEPAEWVQPGDCCDNYKKRVE